jgi:hypothetical protein
MAPFAIVDREREGSEAILMLVEEQANAETIVVELRRRDVQADAVPSTGCAWRSERPLG